jgi:hypothetical protein
VADGYWYLLKNWGCFYFIADRLYLKKTTGTRWSSGKYIRSPAPLPPRVGILVLISFSSGASSPEWIKPSAEGGGLLVFLLSVICVSVICLRLFCQHSHHGWRTLEEIK